MWPVYKQDLNITLENQEKGKNMAMADQGNLFQLWLDLLDGPGQPVWVTILLYFNLKNRITGITKNFLLKNHVYKTAISTTLFP